MRRAHNGEKKLTRGKEKRSDRLVGEERSLAKGELSIIEGKDKFSKPSKEKSRKGYKKGG